MQRALAGIISNGALINGVANFYTTTKPTTRVDGSALVIGDIWKAPDQEITEWDGTNWVGLPRLFFLFSVNSITGTASSNSAFFPLGSKIVLKKFEVTGRVEAAPATPSTDYWTFSLAYIAGGSFSALPSSVFVNNQNVSYTAFNNLAVAATTNQILDFSVAINGTANQRGLQAAWTKNGAAPNLTSVSFSIQYRIVY